MTDSTPATAAPKARALWIVAAIIIAVNAVACTAFGLLIRSPWWGTVIDCAGFTLVSLYAWWLCWRAVVKQ